MKIIRTCGKAWAMNFPEKEFEKNKISAIVINRMYGKENFAMK